MNLQRNFIRHCLWGIVFFVVVWVTDFANLWAPPTVKDSLRQQLAWVSDFWWGYLHCITLVLNENVLHRESLKKSCRITAHGFVDLLLLTAVTLKWLCELSVCSSLFWVILLSLVVICFLAWASVQFTNFSLMLEKSGKNPPWWQPCVNWKPASVSDGF